MRLIRTNAILATARELYATKCGHLPLHHYVPHAFADLRRNWPPAVLSDHLVGSGEQRRRDGDQSPLLDLNA